MTFCKERAIYLAILLGVAACDDEDPGADPDTGVDAADATGDATTDTPTDTPSDTDDDAEAGQDTADATDTTDTSDTVLDAADAPPLPAPDERWSREFDQRFTNIAPPSFGPDGELMVVAVGWGVDLAEPSIVHQLALDTGDDVWSDDELVSMGGGACVITPDGTCWLSDIDTGSLSLRAVSVDGEPGLDLPLEGGENPHIEAIDGNTLVLSQTWSVGIDSFAQGDGEPNWNEPDNTSDNKRVLAVSSDGTVWIGQDDFGIFRRAQNGDAGWTAEFDESPCDWQFAASALTADNLLVAGCTRPEDSDFVVFINDEGDELGRLEIPGDLFSLVLAANGDLLMGTSNGVVRTSPNGDEEHWRTFEGTLVFALSAADNGEVYGLSIENDTEYHIFAVSGVGEPVWDFLPEAAMRFIGWPSLGPDGTLYVPTYPVEGGPVLYALITDSAGLAPSPWPTFNQGYGRTRQQPGM